MLPYIISGFCSVTSTSQVHASAMMLLPIVRNSSTRCWDDL